MTVGQYNTFSSHDGESNTPGWVILWTARIITCVSAVAEGYDLSVFAGVLVLLKPEFQLTHLHLALLVGMWGFCCALGALIGGPVADAWGRKYGLAITYAFLIVGVATMVLSTNVWILILGRSVQALSVGSAFVVVGMYIAELSPAKKRGLFVSLEALFLNIGIFLGSASNFFLLGSTGSSSFDWRLMIGLAAVLPICCLLVVLTPLCPESPRWLHLHGRTEEAAKIIRQILPSDEAAETEYKWQQSAKDDTPVATWSEAIRPANPKDRNNLVQGVGVAVVQMASGIATLIAYAGHILEEDLSHREAFLGMMFVSSAKLGVLFFCIFLLDLVGRKPMLLLSSGMMSASLSVLGWTYTAGEAPWIKVLALAMCIGSFSLGLGCATYVFVSEIFSNRHRGKGSALAFLCSRCVQGVYGFAFPFIVAEYSNGFAFFCLSGILFLGFLFILGSVEETKGRTLEQMQYDECPKF